MMTLVAEAAVRALILALIAWLGLGLARLRDPHLLKAAWTAVLLTSLAMPWLMRCVAAPLIPAPLPALTVTRGAVEALAPHPPVDGFLILYALIAAALLSRQLAAGLRVYLILRAARRIDAPWTAGLDVRVTPALASPATVGTTILLPGCFHEWDPPRLAAVLAHERSHVQERDWHLLWLAQVHACLFWLNPMAWWMRRRLALLAEMTADEAALQAVADRPGYAQILLDFANARTGRSVISMSQHSNVSVRIDRLLSETGPSRPPVPWRRLAAFMAVIPAAVAAGVLQMADAPAARAQSPQHASPQADPQGPRIVDYGALAQLEKYYPPEALRQHIEGVVQLAVTLDRQGRATDTLILSEEPADQGFGAAASSVAHTFQYSNPTGRPAQLTFNVQFALK
jgi:TonB family protein